MERTHADHACPSDQPWSKHTRIASFLSITRDIPLQRASSICRGLIFPTIEQFTNLYTASLLRAALEDTPLEPLEDRYHGRSHVWSLCVTFSTAARRNRFDLRRSAAPPTCAFVPRPRLFSRRCSILLCTCRCERVSHVLDDEDDGTSKDEKTQCCMRVHCPQTLMHQSLFLTFRRGILWYSTVSVSPSYTIHTNVPCENRVGRKACP